MKRNIAIAAFAKKQIITNPLIVILTENLFFMVCPCVVEEYFIKEVAVLRLLTFD